ncbi:MAG: right-handed parallel beta-helix repeat-containing protein [Lachnospiraceae bacterium]|nr:right-handed parallel beta-helix repeat-containing protein [Lachnospiraceae bacterium]
MKSTTGKKILMIVMFACVCVFLSAMPSEAAKKKSFTVTPKTVPVEESYQEEEGYNKNTKQYYMLSSYLEKLGKTGGGTLTLKKGKYKIPATLYVPSNVTIRLKNGVKLVKTDKTGTKKLKATKFIFQTISTKKSKQKRKVADYKASKNVSLTGSGKVTIDMGKVSGATAVYAAHASGLTIKNIHFKNKNGGSYVWVEGSKNVTLTGCKFYKGISKAGLSNQMAVRLETINSYTNEFSGKWSKLDNTPNDNITINKNYFYNQETGIGSVKYVTPKKKVYYQTGIKITGNVFTNPTKGAVYAIGWKAPSITSNTMKQTTKDTKADCYLIGYGLKNPTVTGNTFNGCHYTMKFGTAVNYGGGSSFAKLPSSIGNSYISAWQNNTIANVTHYFITNDSARVFYFQNKTDKNFTLTVNSVPYREHYTEASNYNAKKTYYVFRSYMEQLEYAGGGTITVEAGTYNVTNNICIPSNVTLNLKDGVVFNKQGTTATDISYAKSLFTLVPPSKDGTQMTVSGYNGSHDVKIIGTGTVKIDCRNTKNAMGLVMGHAKNITLRGINFLNQYGSHFIELNSSQNVIVENCHFEGFTPYDSKSYKECINVDGTDEKTNGFNYDWSTHDKTTCKDIYVRNNTFKNIGTAIGSHTYSAEGDTQLYHENVQFYNNEIDGTYNASVRVLNWKDCVIKGNTFKNNQSLNDGKLNSKDEQKNYVTILLRGVVNPTVTGNVFDSSNYYPIRVTLVVGPTTDETALAGYPYTECVISDKNWEDMQNNTLTGEIAEKYRYIVVRTDEDEKDKDAAMMEFVG